MKKNYIEPQLKSVRIALQQIVAFSVQVTEEVNQEPFDTKEDISDLLDMW